MIIDFKSVDEQKILGFKGGQGEVITRNVVDDKCKIMLTTLKPGSSSGLHLHEQNSEVIYVLEGPITFHIDGKTEVAHSGQVHYCPQGHQHYMENLTGHDVKYFALVAEHH